jgi:hypothetical protein
VEESAAVFTRVELRLDQTYCVLEVLDPLELVYLVQVKQQVLEPHVLVVVGEHMVMLFFNSDIRAPSADTAERLTFLLL